MIEKKNVEVVYLDKNDIEQVMKKINSVKDTFSEFVVDIDFWNNSIKALTSGEYALLLYRTKTQPSELYRPSQPGVYIPLVSYANLHNYFDFITNFNIGIRHSFEGLFTRNGSQISFTGMENNNYFLIGAELNEEQHLRAVIQQLKGTTSSQALIRLFFLKGVYLTEIGVTNNISAREVELLLAALARYKTKIKHDEIKTRFMLQTFNQPTRNELENVKFRGLSSLSHEIIDIKVPEAGGKWKETRYEVDERSNDLIMEFSKDI